MKAICKKLFTIALVFTFILPFFSAITYADSEVNTINLQETSLSLNTNTDADETYIFQREKLYNDISTYSATEILVFVGGIVVGYIVDGAIISTTGHSAGWWASEAMKRAKSNVEKVFINDDGTSYGVGASGCVKNSPHGVWHCPYL